ncbi:hypothetical protein MKW98_026060 [Papaver atlanticum]|uniref:Pentatricopeptide repeat-containing protein n=1 Tax=Papaver atlanticum TaxID=357466 RepID=A0AAD4RYE3_9MAGN|nr:hypothetical protein MKW98_026060 [Papaver atlanticum]
MIPHLNFSIPSCISTLSLQLSTVTTSTFSLKKSTITDFNSTPPSLQGLIRKPFLRISCVSAKRKTGSVSEKSESQELYVKIVRTEHCFLLFEELGKKDKWLQCLEIFRWMQKQPLYVADNGVYPKLISVMGKKGQTRMAMWLFSEMRNSGCRPDTSVYNALITAHLHSKDKPKALAKALGYFEKMKGIERSFAQARNVYQVNALFKELEEGIVLPDTYSYNGVMDAYGKNNMIREIEDVLSRMKSNQTKPDIITFNLLIDAYGRRQSFDKMEQVFKSLLRSKEKPTLPTFNSMITNYGKVRLRENAETMYQKMTDMGYTPSFVTYESLITTYGYCDCVSRAREIFDSMVESGKEVPVSTLNAMLDAYCMNGFPTEADLLLDNVCAYTKANIKELIDKFLKRMDKDVFGSSGSGSVSNNKSPGSVSNQIKSRSESNSRLPGSSSKQIKSGSESNRRLPGSSSIQIKSGSKSNSRSTGSGRLVQRNS